MTPRPYQVEGSLWLAQSPRAMLADPPGLGKTAQAILGAKLIQASLIYIVCPAVAVANWLREWRDWWPDGPYPIVVSFDKVVADKKLRVLISLGADLLIIDEGHYLKTPTAKRTKAIYNTTNPDRGLASRAKNVWVLSGTFAPNNVSEYWTHLRALFPELITQPGAPRPMSHMEFLVYFTHWTPTVYGPKIHAVRNRPELSRILNQAGLRREIADVLPDLPELIWGQLTIDSDEARQEIEKLEATSDIQDLYSRIKDHDDFHANTLHLATLRRLIGQSKAQSIVRLVGAELAADAYPKVVIWAHHKDVIRTLAEGLRHFNAVVIDGSTSAVQRERNAHAFETSEVVRVFIGQIQAAGVAINLTAANQVVFAESSWVPAEMLQAAKRCHRYGQTKPVFVRISALARSIDELVAATQTRKLSSHLEIGEPIYASQH